VAAGLARAERGEAAKADEAAVCAVLDCALMGGFGTAQVQRLLAAVDAGLAGPDEAAQVTGLSRAEAARLLDELAEARRG
jgi:hypothetical protein